MPARRALRIVGGTLDQARKSNGRAAPAPSSERSVLGVGMSVPPILSFSRAGTAGNAEPESAGDAGTAGMANAGMRRLREPPGHQAAQANLGMEPESMSQKPPDETEKGSGEQLDVLRGHEALDEEISGLDALELPKPTTKTVAARVWERSWPKLAAAAMALAGWQLLVASGWKPRYVLPPPRPVLGRLWEDLASGNLATAVAITMRRAAVGYGLAIVIGLLVGSAVVWFKPLRVAVGSLVTGLESMPSIAWFPLAILLFRLSEAAITFVVVLGAAPAIANGLIAGVDDIPPLLLRAGRAMGARGLDSYRYVVLPAALPSFVDGLKQGWAFAWRSLVAGELLVIIANQPSIGVKLQFARDLSDTEGMLAILVVILLLGMILDALVFTALSRFVKRRRGLVPG